MCHSSTSVGNNTVPRSLIRIEATPLILKDQLRMLTCAPPPVRHLVSLRELAVEGNPFCQGHALPDLRDLVLEQSPASLTILDASEVSGRDVPSAEMLLCYSPAEHLLRRCDFRARTAREVCGLIRVCCVVGQHIARGCNPMCTSV